VLPGTTLPSHLQNGINPSPLSRRPREDVDRDAGDKVDSGLTRGLQILRTGRSVNRWRCSRQPAWRRQGGIVARLRDAIATPVQPGASFAIAVSASNKLGHAALFEGVQQERERSRAIRAAGKHPQSTELLLLARCVGIAGAVHLVLSYNPLTSVPWYI
jgi:hypothetical protein